MALFSGLLGGSAQIGISIGTSSIKAAEVKKSGQAFTLVNWAIEQLPDEAITNREIVNHMAVVDAIRNLAARMKIKGRDVVTSVSGASVIVKKILLDQTNNTDLPDVMRHEAEQYVPFNIDEVSFDYEVLNKNGPEGKMEIMLVASKKGFLESYQSVLRDAGLKANIIDVDSFALQNAFEFNYQDHPTVALVDIGAAALKIVVCSNGQPVFTRDSAVGGRALTVEIQKHLNLTYNEAELLKIDSYTQGQMPQEVADLTQVMSENFASEIKRSLDFFTASSTGSPVSLILLAGGSCRLPNLAQFVESITGVRTQILDPFQSVLFDQKAFGPEEIATVSSIAAVPLGLAMRGFYP